MTDVLLGLLTTFGGIITTVGLAAIPWAFAVHAKLAVLATSLRRLDDLPERVTKLEARRCPCGLDQKQENRR